MSFLIDSFGFLSTMPCRKALLALTLRRLAAGIERPCR